MAMGILGSVGLRRLLYAGGTDVPQAADSDEFLRTVDRVECSVGLCIVSAILSSGEV